MTTAQTPAGGTPGGTGAEPPPDRARAWRVGWSLARYQPALSLGSLALWIGFHSLPFLLGLLLQRIFDALSGDAPAGGVYGIVGVLVAMELTRLVVFRYGVRVFIAAWNHAGMLARLNLLRAQVASGGPEAGTMTGSTGEVVNRFRDDVEDVLRFTDTWIDTIGISVGAVFAVVVMVRIDPVVTVAVVLPVVAMIVVGRLLGGRIRAYRRAYRQATATVSGFLGELFAAALAIKAAAAQDAALDRVAGYNQHRRHTAVRDRLLSELLDSFNNSTVDVSIGLVLLLAVPAMRRGDFTVGDLTLFVSYATVLAGLPYYGGRMLAIQRQASVSVERLSGLLPGPADRAEAALTSHRPLHLFGGMPPAAQPDPALAPVAAIVPTAPRQAPLRALQVAGLTALHPSSGRGVVAADLTLERGTLTVVTGAVGSGKTTLLRALLGLLPAQAGTVSWNGEAVGDLAAFMVPPSCAYVPQVPRLFSESLADNVLLGADPAGADLSAALHRAVLDTDVAAMPEGTATLVGARGVRLSGGQAQRAATARATVRGTDLLVLDDVSSALDVETERHLWDRLLADRETTFLVVSNRPATIARADQVLHVDRGRIVPAAGR